MFTKEVLEKKHTAQDYLKWVEQLVSAVKTEPDGVRKIRLREGLSKYLMEEAFPLGCLASNYFKGSPDVLIGLKIGSQNYDAVVEDSRDGETKTIHVEITQAHEGEDEYLRMLALHENGNVSALGPVSKTGTKRSGLCIKVDSIAVSQQEVLERESKRIGDAIARKLGKPYPKNTLLLVAFDDIMAHDREDNINNIRESIDRSITVSSNISEIVVVGLHNNLCIEKRLN